MAENTEQVARYYILARFMPPKRPKQRRRLDWYGVGRTGESTKTASGDVVMPSQAGTARVPVVAIVENITLLARMDTKKRVYELDDKFKTAFRRDGGIVTAEYPATIQFTKPQIALLLRGFGSKCSHWMKPPAEGLETKPWDTTSTSR